MSNIITKDLIFQNQFIKFFGNTHTPMFPLKIKTIINFKFKINFNIDFKNIFFQILESGNKGVWVSIRKNGGVNFILWPTRHEITEDFHWPAYQDKICDQEWK